MKRALAIALLASFAVGGCGGHASQAAADDPDADDDAPTVAATMPATVVDPAATAALRTFEGRDANHDGFVSAAENAAAADKIFHAIDTDQDGAITVPEYTAARVALGLTTLPGSEELIAQADQDGDGKLTLAEWIASEGRNFKEADKDADEKLSRAEWAALPRLETRNAGAAPAESASPAASDAAQ